MLNDDNLVIFAAQNYYSPLGIDAEEFHEDLKRLKYVKRLLNRYIESERLSERLILNHLIVIFNVFGIPASLKILEFKMDDNQWKVMKPFLVFLKYIRNDEYVNIIMDKNVIEALRKI